MQRSPKLPVILSVVLLVGCAAHGAVAAEVAGGRYPAGPRPDQVVLTWAGDPCTSISIQWRTSTAVASGAVAYLPRAEWQTIHPAPPTVVKATTQPLTLPEDQPACNRHTAALAGLRPGTEYLYSVGDGSGDGWGEMRAFRTAPSAAEPFAFVYMGDAQYGFSRWGALLRSAARCRPDAAFYLMAGDIVTRGNDRDDWDDVLANASPVLSTVPLVPAIGNHECKPDRPRMYLELFDLPRNGPSDIDPERAYSMRYGDVLLVVLDSNLPPQSQATWLQETLEGFDAVWKLVMLHHPLYSSEPKRDNAELRAVWGPIFDACHVDVVFQGHDHAYMRTFPMRAGVRAVTPAEGTIYLVSVSGTKMYEQLKRDYTEVGFTDIATYSVVDILPADSKVASRLLYRAYDIEGNLVDQFSIDKPSPAPAP